MVVLTLSEAAFDGNITFAEDGVCDEDCLISKSNFHLKNNSQLHRSDRQTCSLQGIDTSASDESFKLFGRSNAEYHLDYLTRPNGTCDCSKSIRGYKHAVVKKEINGKMVLTDVYVSCGEASEDENVLEGLIFDYIKNVPERTLGIEPELEKGDENCLDENGFISPKLPGEIPCFSYISAFSNGTYSATNQLLEVNVSYYSGPFSVNRIDQSEYVIHPDLPAGKSSSMLALFDDFQQTCFIHESDNEYDNHCHAFFNNVIYAFICCCNKNPGQCSFRRYKQKSLICAEGSYSMEMGKTPVASTEHRSATETKEFLANKTFCSSKYTLTNKRISYIMPAPRLTKCNAGAGDKGYCTLDNDVCPSDIQNPSETTITCCCREPDLCNVDFVALKAVDRYEFMVNNKVCDQPMLYSVLFARTNYTLFEDHKQPLCYIHYDENHPSARYFLANNNLDLLRDVDYLAYQKEGCNVIAAKIRPVVPEKCPKEKYSFDDTKLPRPLFLCTCNGTKIGTETSKDTKFCDAELKNNIHDKYNQLKDKLMPKCFVTKNPIKSFDETVSFDAILKSGTINMTTKSIFCYMEVTKDSNVKENDTVINFSLTAGIALLENGYGEKCYTLYQKKQKNGESTEKAFCDSPKNSKTICCMIGMEKEPVKLLDEIKEKVVEQKAIRYQSISRKYYQKQKSLKCRTSKHTREFGKECKHPHGCFWTDSSTGEVKTTSIAGCIDTIPKLLEKNSSNPIYRSLQTCLTISRMRRLKKLDEKEKLKEPYRCFATNEINYPDEKDQLTNVFVVCCCTEIDENGRCDKKDNSKKSYGAKVIDVANNKISKQHKNQIYSVPF